MARVISDTKRELDEAGDEDEDGEIDEAMETAEDGKSKHRNSREFNIKSRNSSTAPTAAGRSNPDDEYNFDAYDTEEATQVAAIGDIATVDPAEGENVSDGEDSEAEDDKIKPDDNLVLVGHVDDDAASLEVYGKDDWLITTNELNRDLSLVSYSIQRGRRQHVRSS